MEIDIFSDTICPWCFIGKRRLERALRARPQPELDLTRTPDIPETPEPEPEPEPEAAPEAEAEAIFKALRAAR